MTDSRTLDTANHPRKYISRGMRFAKLLMSTRSTGAKIQRTVGHRIFSSPDVAAHFPFLKNSLDKMDVFFIGETMKHIHNDGGRAAAGFKGSAGDCVVRAVAIASGRPYAEVYAACAKGMGNQRKSKGATARNGVSVRRKWFKDYMAALGFKWVPTMLIGQGCKVHLRADELPMGRLVVAVSRHYTAVLDGVIHDTYDPSADRGTTIYPLNTPAAMLPKKAKLLSNGNGWAYEPERCVYGYWIPAEEGLA